MRSRAAIVLACAVILCGAASGCGPHEDRGAAWRALSHGADSLAFAGAPDRALALLREAAAAREIRGDHAWLAKWADARAAELARWNALPDSARAALRASAAPAPESVQSEDPRGIALLAPLAHQLEVRRRWLGDDDSDVAATWAALARVQFDYGDYSQARLSDRSALRIRRARFGEDSPEAAESELHLGHVMKLADVSSAAVAAIEDSALITRERRFGRESLEYAEAELARGNVHRWRNERAPAEACFAHVLAVRRRLEGPRSPGVAEVLFHQALAMLRDQEWARIEKLTREGGELIAHEPRVRRLRAEMCNLQGNALRHLGRDVQAVSVLQLACAMQESLRAGAPADPFVRSRLFPVTAYGDLAAAQLISGDSLAAWLSLDRSLSRQWLETRWSRGELTPDHAWDSLFTRVRARLDDSTAAVGWLDAWFRPADPGNPSWAWVVRRDEPVHWVRLEGRDMAAGGYTYWFTHLRQRLAYAANWPFASADHAEIDRDARHSYELRFAPLEPLLHGATSLIVVSPSVNQMTPIETFIDLHGRSLAQRFAITYALSALEFASDVRSDDDTRTRAWRGLIVRGPDRTEGGIVAPLPGGEAETRWLRARLAHADVLEGSDASESRLRAWAAKGRLAGYDLVHIAAHADSRRGWDREAWLYLGAADTARGATHADTLLGARREGRLTLGDVREWRLHARLVTLAGCTSGGATMARTEGLVGLGAAFLEAGAQQVLVSLWPVDDHATELLMERFYSNLLRKGPGHMSAAGSLRDARAWLRAYRAPDGTQPYEHPVDWAGFVLVGAEPRPGPGEDFTQ